MTARWLLATALLLCSCGPPPPAFGTVAPASGDELAAYSEAITERVNRATDASLYEYFCATALAAPCPADLEARLAPFRTRGAGSRLDLADAFTRLRAAIEKDDPNGISQLSDEEYLGAAYRVALGREIDDEGGRANLEFLRRTGERKTVLRSLLQSNEFRSK
ncbi:DUF4214 domain-containing protein [bacterium]|nr:DUF4214 domain-containing protein [bacterium]